MLGILVPDQIVVARGSIVAEVAGIADPRMRGPNMLTQVAHRCGRVQALVAREFPFWKKLSTIKLKGRKALSLITEFHNICL